jgi:hypothetical protein
MKALILIALMVFSTALSAHEWGDPDLVNLTRQQEALADAYLLGKLDVYLLVGAGGNTLMFQPYMCFYTALWDEYWNPYVFNIRHYLAHGGYVKKGRFPNPEPFIITLRRMALETIGCGEWNYFQAWHPEYYE